MKDNRRRTKRGRGRDREERDNEFIDKLVHINRVAKVVKGGRRFGFAALVVVGDQQRPRRLRPWQGARSAGSHPQGDRRRQEARWSAFRSRTAAPCITKCAAIMARARCIVRPAPAGTGIIAGGPMRAVFEALGVGDVVSKSLGTSNPYNMVRATFDALKHQQSPRMVAQRRGRSVARNPCHAAKARPKREQALAGD